MKYASTSVRKVKPSLSFSIVAFFKALQNLAAGCPEKLMMVVGIDKNTLQALLFCVTMLPHTPKPSLSFTGILRQHMTLDDDLREASWKKAQRVLQGTIKASDQHRTTKEAAVRADLIKATPFCAALASALMVPIPRILQRSTLSK